MNNKYIPVSYLLASFRQRQELLRGLMDTDGCVNTRGTCEFTQREGRLANDVFALLRTLGYKATRHKYVARLYGKDCGLKTRICFNPDKGERIFKIPRKQERLDNKTRQDREDKRRFFIESVTDTDACRVNCIQVEGGMYLAGFELVPTHNSEGSSRMLPSDILGHYPDKKIIIASYAATVAKDFNRDCQRIIDSDEYRAIFPDTVLNRSNVVTVATNYLRNSDVFEVVGHAGSLRVVGRGGSLTSKTADVIILDDLYKDAQEANSPVIREGAWDWYTKVVLTRLHNDSQQLIVFTRWHPEDIIGRIMDSEQVVEAKYWSSKILMFRLPLPTPIESTPSSGKLATTEFTSEMSGTDEIIPANIMADEDNYYWTVGITADGYTFTNANGDTIGYGNSGTNFVMNSEKTLWTIANGISEEGSLVPNYQGFNIVNATTENRAFALRVTETENIVKAYATSNMANGEYNFFLDIFMQGEGGEPPIPTVAAPTFNPAGGTYYEPQNVTISCATEGATIWYSPISENGPWTPYTEPIAVEEFASIWAYASKEGYNDSPVVNSEYIIQDDIVIIFWQEWENDWEPWQGWTERCTMGDSLWRVASYGGNHYAYANGYNHPQTIDWLISPAFDLDSYDDVVLTFRTAKNYNGPDLEVFFSNDYDGENPDGATWIPLPCELSQGGWNWVASGDISLDEFSGSNCYIGFKYTSDEDAAGWEVDDIKLASGSTSPTPTLIATPNYLGDFSYVVGHGPSESQSYILSGVNLEDDGEITIVSCSFYEISMDNETFGGVLTFPCTDLPTTIYVRMMEGLAPYTYDGVYILNTYAYEDDYVYVAVNVSGIVHYEYEPVMTALMPLYIQGNNGSNNNRVPMAAPVQFANLEPNTTYHYTNQFVDENDGPETAGAGNVIYANPEGFYRSTSPSLATEGGYGEFTTDEEGHAAIWLMNEPTANARFTPGNHVYLRVRLNGGGDGTMPAYFFTSEDYATVLNFGTEYDENQGTAFYVKSDEAPMSFAQMYAAEDELRPVYSTSIETTGVDYGSINQYADFYKEEVAGKDGWFGGIMPNDNNDGINFILVFDMDNNLVSGYYTTEGQWSPNANTVNPTNGLDEPIFIDLTDVGVGESAETNVKIWSTDNEFIIENGDNSHYTMTVYNVLGQPMMQQQINAGSTERIGHNLATGLYVISLQNNQNKVSVKVMVK